ncbi:hypothetical protein HME9302_02113 [Alteripontixanthobacter maritimus]|uniref:Tyr recombinase domain-containing protein n=2 Tax=Alteripontixanthobacter maritimus TaxID=2161824 RepID=A0A369QCD5_9SPHN|nr:hypothetical protein HME9302_02113 [Alteripontixanthobacter maritimus]
MVPLDAQPLIGRKEIWRSLRTDSVQIALRRLPMIVGAIEADIEQARKVAGREVDPNLLPTVHTPSQDDLIEGSATVSDGLRPIDLNDCRLLTLGDAYARYINDPTKAWSPSTREAYETCRRTITSIVGNNVLMSDLARTHCRDLLEVLRFLPTNATKRFPNLTHRQASDRAKKIGDDAVISAANANSLMSNFSSFLNWAVNEELMQRNPLRGLRLPDPVARRDKRRPFDRMQLQQIFNAPLFCGCVDGERGYNKVGMERPRNARFWVPLIALHSGARLGEITQLDVSDIRFDDGIHHIAITVGSMVGSGDKVLKTRSSERRIPLHPTLIALGLPQFAQMKKRTGAIKLFDDIEAGSTESRATAFSKWFTQFLRASGARQQRTSFHSFRHNFRDELRAADINHDIAMLLGGWATGGTGRQGVSDNYGSGFKLEALHEAISKLAFKEINLSHLAQDAR